MYQKYDIPLCQNCKSRAQSLFCELGEEILQQIDYARGYNFYKKGQYIFYEGNTPSNLYCLNKGKVKIYKILENGKLQILRLAKEGDLLGYRSLMSGHEYQTVAETLEDSFACFIPKAAFLDILQKDKTLTMRFTRFTCQELEAAEQQILNLARKTVRERMAEAVIILGENFGYMEDNCTLNIELSRQDLADMVGSSTESVIRLLSDFKDQNLVALGGRKIQLLDMKGLRKAAKILNSKNHDKNHIPI